MTSAESPRAIPVDTSDLPDGAVETFAVAMHNSPDTGVTVGHYERSRLPERHFTDARAVGELAGLAVTLPHLRGRQDKLALIATLLADTLVQIEDVLREE